MQTRPNPLARYKVRAVSAQPRSTVDTPPPERGEELIRIPDLIYSLSRGYA